MPWKHPIGLALGLALAGCQAPLSSNINVVTGELDGTLVHRGQVAFPPSSEASVMLQRARPGREDESLAVMTIPDPGRTPIRFTLPYERSRIDAATPYVLRARIILESGRVAWQEKVAVPVFRANTNGRAIIALERRDPPSDPNTLPDNSSARINQATR